MTVTLAAPTRTAKKPHQCQLCLLQIHPGESYVDERCAGEGRAWAFKRHEECVDLARAFDAVNPDGTFERGCLWDAVGYAWDDIQAIRDGAAPIAAPWTPALTSRLRVILGAYAQ